MKCPLLERQQHRRLRITPRPLGKDKHALPLLLHLLRRALKRPQRRRAVRPIDKNGPRQRHEPAQKRRAFQTLLRGDGAVGREDFPEEQHVEGGLVVADEDGGAGGQVGGAGEDLEVHAGEQSHGVLEGAGGGELRGVLEGEEAEGEGGEDAVEGAEGEGGVGGEEAGVEGEGGEGGCEGEGEESGG